jgi:RNA polymerase sigma-70 factor (ECF subfamily)
MVNVLSEELRPVAPRVRFDDDDDLDASLVSAAQAGDLQAFSRLYDRHHDRLVRFCRSRLGNADDAADAAQETFLRAWRSLDTFGRRGSVYPWLHAIARNVCTDTLRKRLRVDTADDRALGSLPDTGMTALERLDIEVDNAVLRAALERLSDRHREILSLREYEGWSYERIADEEHLELNAVKSLVWRARQALRREFLLLDTDGGRFGGFLGLGLLLRRALPSARRAVDRIAFAAGELTSAGSSAASHAGLAAASAVGVAAVAVGVSIAPPPPAPPAAVAAVVSQPAVTSHLAVTSPPTATSTSGGAGALPALAPADDDAGTEGEDLSPAPADDASSDDPSTTAPTTVETTPRTGSSPRADGGQREGSTPTTAAPSSNGRTLLLATSPTTVKVDAPAKATGSGNAAAAKETGNKDAGTKDAGTKDTGNGNAGTKDKTETVAKADTKADTASADKGNGNGIAGSKSTAAVDDTPGKGNAGNANAGSGNAGGSSSKKK